MGPDLSNFLLVPVIRTRDSGIRQLSNFNTALKMLGGESDTVQIHRFGHWGCGWFERILIDPKDARAVAKGEDIESCLADCPILDDSDYSEREWEYAQETWRKMSLRERIELCKKYNESIFAARHDTIPQDNDGCIFYACRSDAD